MQLYFYAKSGHTVGLEETKRCSAIANALKEFNPILCTSDFRAGAFAKENFGIKKYVNVDVVRNLHNIMQRGDILIYETPEVNNEMKEDMKDFCSLLYGINDDLQGIVVDTTIYSPQKNPSLEKTLFFGDDDYNNLLLEMLKKSDNFEINLLMGHYFFLGNEKIFKNHFTNVIDEEEYVNTILNSKYLLTTSFQTALESIYCGNRAVLLKREDKTYNEALICELNLPTINKKELFDIFEEFDLLIKNYPKINNFNIINLEKIKEEIKNKIELFSKLSNL